MQPGVSSIFVFSDLPIMHCGRSPIGAGPDMPSPPPKSGRYSFGDAPQNNRSFEGTASTERLLMHWVFLYYVGRSRKRGKVQS